MKRFFAWVLLLGFVLLLVNIMVFQYFMIPSIAIYLVVAIFFLFFMNKPLPSNKKKSNNSNRRENETINHCDNDSCDCGADSSDSGDSSDNN